MPAWQKRQPCVQPPLDLHGGAVVHGLQEGHDGARERRRQLLDDAALDDRRRFGIERFEGGEAAAVVVARLVEGGHVGSRQRQQVAQARGAGRARALPAARQLGQLGDGLLALAQHEGVDEGRERFGVEGGAAARDDDGVVLAAVARARGDARQVEHVEHVRVGQLVLQVKPRTSNSRRAWRVSRLQRGAPARRISASMSGQGAKARSQSASGSALSRS